MDYVKLLQDRIAKASVEYNDAKASLLKHIELLAYMKCKKLNEELRRSYLIHGETSYPIYSYCNVSEYDFSFTVIMVKKIDVNTVAKKFLKRVESYNSKIDEFISGSRFCLFRGEYDFGHTPEYKLMSDVGKYFYEDVTFHYDMSEILADDFMSKGIRIRER